VSIHPFPNGNGRFSRLFADLLVLTNGQKRFSWGRSNLIEDGVVRKNYLAALKAADRNEYGQLFNFADS
jgi:fido (protein-threonine AMPylation protein)